MKKFIGILSCVISSAAFSFVGDGKYQGSGDWKSPDGKTGTWQEETTVTKTDEGCDVASKLTITVDGQTTEKNMTMTVKKKSDNGFFAIYVEGEKRGGGYCFDHVCHYGMKGADGSKVEETLHMSEKGTHKIGSAKHKHTDKAGQSAVHMVAWRGAMQRVEQ
jgi:hypothetical protein